MLGSVKINKKQYTEDEYKLFKSYYCTLCKNIKERYGYIYTIFLSFDITYIFMLQTINIDKIASQWLCAITRKIKTMDMDKDIISFYSDVNMLSVYFKNIDNIHDQNSVKSKFMNRMMKSVISKIKNNNPILFRQYEQVMLNLFENEKNYSDDDYLLTIKSFSKDLSSLFTIDRNSSRGKIMSKMTYHIIFFIYLNDAIEDIESDIKKKQFNPIIKKGKFESENIYEMNRTKEDIKEVLTQNTFNFEILLDSNDSQYEMILKKLYYSIMSENTQCFFNEEGI